MFLDYTFLIVKIRGLPPLPIQQAVLAPDHTFFLRKIMLSKTLENKDTQRPVFVWPSFFSWVGTEGLELFKVDPLFGRSRKVMVRKVPTKKGWVYMKVYI